MVEFLRAVFDAQGDYQSTRPSEVWLGESLVMVGDEVDRRATQSFIYIYVEDTDKVYERGLAHGAKAIEPPAEMPYGDRRAMIEDPWGTRWQIATHRGFAT